MRDGPADRVADPDHEPIVRALLARAGLPAAQHEVALFVQAYRNVIDASRVVAGAAVDMVVDPAAVFSLERYATAGDDDA
jgi:hypothetical protein